MSSTLSPQIYSRAVEISSRYKKAEAELLEILDQVDRHRVYLTHGHSSLFLYVVCELGLSESMAYNLITVSRKARQVPEVKTLIANGSMTLSSARRITSVLTPQNKTEWLEKAATLTQRQLEKEVAKVRPQAAVPEGASYISGDRVKLQVCLSEKDMLALRRVQDLLSQARGRAVSLEETITTMTQEHLKRFDPVMRAKRQIAKKGVPFGTPFGTQPDASQAKIAQQRVPIPANLLHQIRLRDQGRCTYTHDNGKRCNQSRWVEIHHKIPVSEGGPNTLENLTTHYSSHHDWIHTLQTEPPTTARPAS
ncbi:HNH endonuclease signature motif containing protein [Bdellovibrionota bacterium FG-2]